MDTFPKTNNILDRREARWHIGMSKSSSDIELTWIRSIVNIKFFFSWFLIRRLEVRKIWLLPKPYCNRVCHLLQNMKAPIQTSIETKKLSNKIWCRIFEFQNIHHIVCVYLWLETMHRWTWSVHGVGAWPEGWAGWILHVCIGVYYHHI